MFTKFEWPFLENRQDGDHFGSTGGWMWCLRAMRRHDTLLLSGDRGLPVGRPGEGRSLWLFDGRSKRNRRRKRMRQLIVSQRRDRTKCAHT